MSDQPNQPRDNSVPGERRWLDTGHDNVMLIYILYFVSLAVGITALIGLIIAYINRGQASGYVQSHYTWLIRTFWIGVLYAAVSTLLTVIGIGFLLLLAVFVWLIIRLVVGLQALGRRESVPNPQSWWVR